MFALLLIQMGLGWLGKYCHKGSGDNEFTLLLLLKSGARETLSDILIGAAQGSELGCPRFWRNQTIRCWRRIQAEVRGIMKIEIVFLETKNILTDIQILF